MYKYPGENGEYDLISYGKDGDEGGEGLDRDINTVALGAALVATDELSEQVAYDVTKALVENVDQIRRVHTSMRALSPELMGALRVIPYHPGALRYYREADLVD